MFNHEGSQMLITFSLSFLAIARSDYHLPSIGNYACTLQENSTCIKSNNTIGKNQRDKSSADTAEFTCQIFLLQVTFLGLIAVALKKD